MTVQEKALRYLYREQRNAKRAYSQAEYRTGVTQEELDNLSAKLEGIDYCITLVLAATPDAALPVEFLKRALPMPILKRALVEVRELCWERAACSPDCPLFITKYGGCPMKFTDFPEEWNISDWKEGNR